MRRNRPQPSEPRTPSRTAALVAGVALAGAAVVTVASPPAAHASTGAARTFGTIGTTAYFSDGLQPTTITAYNVTTGTVTATIEQPVEVGTPPEMAYNPNGSAVYLAQSIPDGSTDLGMLGVLSTATNKVTAEIPIGDGPTGLAVSPGGGTVYVADGLSDTVSVVDTATDAVTATIPVGGYPSGVAVSPDGSTVYAADENSGQVSMIDTADNAVTANIPVSPLPVELAETPDGSALYVTGYVEDATGTPGAVSVINTATNTVTSTTEKIPGAYSVAMTPSAWVSSVSPDGGPPAGGNQVILTGTDFAQATAVDFGGVPATFTIDTPTTITAEAPAGTTGTVDVTVTTPTGTSPTQATDQYGYAGAPTVTAVTPAYGLSGGGATVTITGTGLVGPVTVLFGSTPVEKIYSQTPTTLKVESPPGPANTTVDITVTTDMGTSAVTSTGDTFRYFVIIHNPTPPVTVIITSAIISRVM